jgi:transforming growth factor-beta-induced protein
MKTYLRNISMATLAVAMVFILASCSKDEEETPMMESKNIVETAVSNNQFSILTEALTKAGLVSALEGPGPFTVFAPTNDAFNALFTDLGVNGIDDLTADQLTPILLYHVVSGNIRASQVTSGDVPTLKEGSTIDISANGMGVMLNGSANVIATDVQGINGVIHVIDRVILP